jgi:hypothetical protein
MKKPSVCSRTPHRFIASLALMFVVTASVPAAEPAGEPQQWDPEHRVAIPETGIVPITIKRYVGSELTTVPVEKLAIYRNGKRLDVKTTGPGGSTDVRLPPGIYSFFAGNWRSKNGFGSTAVRLVPASDPDASKLPHSIEMTLVPPSDAMMLLRTMVGLQRNRPTAAGAAGATESVPAPRTAGMSDLLLRGNAAQAAFRAAAKSSAEVRREVLGADLGKHPFSGPWYNNHKILLAEEVPVFGRFRSFQKSGELVGIANADVLFLQDSKLVRRARTDLNGSYSADIKDGGVYSVVATDGRAFGCYAIKLEKHGSPKPNPESLPVRRVSFMQAGGQSGDLNSSTATPEDTEEFLDDEVPSTDTGTTPTNTAAGGPGGGGVGGGVDPFAAAAIGAGVGAATGFLISELTASKNN